MPLTIWNESTRDELNALLPNAVIIFPTAATEQHGPHLATGHDTFAVTDIAMRAATSASGNFVLAPTLGFGSSQHHVPFGGTLSLSTETYYRVVRDLVESAIAGGARKVFLLNGHGGNHELNQLVARDVALSVSDVTIAAASYWEIARTSILADSRLGSLTLPGHAGQFETSTMLATSPQHVREPRAVRAADPFLTSVPVIPGTRVEQNGSWQAFEGYTDFPHLATAELGEQALEIITRDVAAAFSAFERG